MRIPILLSLLLVIQFSGNGASAALFKKGGEWKKNELIVCIVNDESFLQRADVNRGDVINENNPALLQKFPDHLRELLKKSVTDSFSSIQTGIHFVGWKNCDQSVRPDIALFYSSDPSPEFAVSQIGRPMSDTISLIRFNAGLQKEIHKAIRSSFVLSGEYVRPDPNKIRRLYEFADFVFAKAAVHEFGHIAGFYHEQNRNDQDDILKLIDLSEKQEFSEGLEFGAMMNRIWEKDAECLGPFDPLSTMGYSWLDLAMKLIRIQGMCQNPKSFIYSQSAIKPMLCSSEKLNMLLAPTQESGSLFSILDQEALASVYLHQHLSSRNLVDLDLITWIEAVRSILISYPKLQSRLKI